MHGKNADAIYAKKPLILLIFTAALLLLSAAASAQQVSVSLEPVYTDAANGLYVMETAEYNLLVINNTNEKIENLDVYLTADGGLALLIDGSESPSQRVTFSSVPANGRQFKGITVKATGTSLTEQKIKAEYH